jgi:DNA repair protein RadC
MNAISDYFEKDESSSVNKISVREETLKNGLSFPTDEELLMLILGTGTKKSPVNVLAKQVLDIVLSSNRENLIENLMRVDGMGKSKALLVAASLEFGKRLNRNPQSCFNCPSDIIPYIQNYAMQKQEHFLCISLNGAKEVLSIRVVCVGVKNMAIVEAREVFSEALKEHASAVIICHNHPSGNANPSFDDIKITCRLSQAAEILGIKLLDHIIITRLNYFSFLEHDFMDMNTMLSLIKNCQKYG